MFYEKYRLLNGVTSWCSGVTRSGVPKIHLWPLRRDDLSGVLIGADGTRRFDWLQTLVHESIDSPRARSNRQPACRDKRPLSLSCYNTPSSNYATPSVADIHLQQSEFPIPPYNGKTVIKMLCQASQSRIEQIQIKALVLNSLRYSSRVGLSRGCGFCKPFLYISLYKPLDCGPISLCKKCQ